MSEFGNQQQFSTKDKDNDIHWTLHCARDHNRAAWWYSDCGQANLNGDYYMRSGSKSIFWFQWKENWESLKTTKMMIHNKPKGDD